MSKLLKRSELVALLSGGKGGRFVTLTTRTMPRMKKTGNPYFGRVERVAKRNGQIGVDYQNSVNNQLGREGKDTDFEAYPLPWGEHHNAYFVAHKGNFYLKYKPKSTLADIWVDTETGEELSVDKLQEFLPKQSESRQGTDNEIQWRTIAVDSISQIAVDGETYELV